MGRVSDAIDGRWPPDRLVRRRSRRGHLALAVTSVWWPLGILVLLQGLVFRQLRVQISRIVSGKDPQAAADFVADTLVHRTLDLDVLTGLLTTLERRSRAIGCGICRPPER